jgi:hypothetical protein
MKFEIHFEFRASLRIFQDLNFWDATRVEHVEVFFCPCSTARRDRKPANLGKNPAQASS